MPSRIPYLLFFFSGFCALVYEVVWTRWLVLVFGGTVPSASTVLSGFMGGFALGALLASRLEGKGSPLRLYAWVELLVAASAAAFPLGLRALQLAAEHTDLPWAPLRLVLVLGMVLPPAVLMGATFPLMSRRCAADGPGAVGRLYAANLTGACLGVLATAFFFLAFLGLAGTHWLAVGLNLLVAVAALRASRDEAPVEAPAPPAEPAAWTPGLAAFCVFVSGLCGMAFEVVWVRLLVPSFNNSAYGFSAVLMVFLGALGLGSWLASRLGTVRPATLGGLQWLAALFAFLGFGVFELSQLLQSRYADLTNSGVSPFFFLPLAEAAVVLGPLAVLQGMMLPAAVRLHGGPAGAAVGRLYFWNTLGGILGALAAGFWWIPAYNVQNALLLSAATALAGGAVLMVASAPGERRRWLAPAGALAAAALAWGQLRGRNVPSEILVEWAEGRNGIPTDILSYTEDREGSVAVQRRGAFRFLVINGVGVAGETNATKLLAHIPLALHPAPKRVLIICFGLGTTFRSVLSHPVERVENVEIVGGVLEAFPYFHKDAKERAGDPRASLVVADGRHHLLRDREGYDLILVDPSPPLYAAGTVNLYSRDFFELARRRLKPGGIAGVWLPEYPEPEFKMVFKSFVQAFPAAEAWLGTYPRGGIVMLGSEAPLVQDRERVRSRLARAQVRQDLLELNGEFEREAAFWKLYLGPASRFEAYLASSPVVTDDFPRIEYPYFRSKDRAYFRRPEMFDWPPFAPSAAVSDARPPSPSAGR